MRDFPTCARAANRDIFVEGVRLRKVHRSRNEEGAGIAAPAQAVARSTEEMLSL
jgi:ribosomal protein L24